MGCSGSKPGVAPNMNVGQRQQEAHPRGDEPGRAGHPAALGTLQAELAEHCARHAGFGTAAASQRGHKWPPFRGHSWPPRAPQAASEVLRPLSKAAPRTRRSDPSLQIPGWPQTPPSSPISFSLPPTGQVEVHEARPRDPAALPRAAAEGQDPGRVCVDCMVDWRQQRAPPQEKT